ncbi:MAG TPA: hypothetical protein DEO73_17480 [Pantoea sp.]|nr:hypothetical protein [Pantoea sp.]
MDAAELIRGEYGFGKIVSPFAGIEEADAVTIGEFTISNMSEGVVWIEGGEEDAMEVSEQKLIAALRQFYDSNF